MCSLLFPKVSVKKIHYCGKIFGETDLIDLVSCTDWSMASNGINFFNSIQAFLLGYLPIKIPIPVDYTNIKFIIKIE